MIYDYKGNILYKRLKTETLNCVKLLVHISLCKTSLVVNIFPPSYYHLFTRCYFIIPTHVNTVKHSSEGVVLLTSFRQQNEFL